MSKTASILAALTVVSGALAPIIAWVLRRRKSGIAQFIPIRTYIKDYVAFVIDRQVRRRLSLILTLHAYASRQLAQTGATLLVPGYESVDLPIDDVYTRLTLRRTRDIYNDLDILTVKDLGILVVGDPGSGKSSICKRLFREACRTAIMSTKAPLPILVPLAEISYYLERTPEEDVKQDSCSILLEYVRRHVAESPDFDAPGLFEGALTYGGVLLLLDGLDEVKPDLVDRIQRELVFLRRTLARRSPTSKVVVTVRSQLYPRLNRDFMESYSAVFRIRPFGVEDIYTLLERWPNTTEIERTRLFRRITGSRSLTENVRATPRPCYVHRIRTAFGFHAST